MLINNSYICKEGFTFNKIYGGLNMQRFFTNKKGNKLILFSFMFTLITSSFFFVGCGSLKKKADNFPVNSPTTEKGTNSTEGPNSMPYKYQKDELPIFPYTSAKDLSKAYIEALQNSDGSFIFDHTSAAGKAATLEAEKKIWSTVKIDSVKIIDSEVRDTKAYYELEINVTEPGSSLFNKGKNTRWLYLSSSPQAGLMLWQAEGLMSSGKPDENWLSSK